MRKVAIIGAGFIASAHVNALIKRRDVKLTVVVDPSVTAAAALAASAGGSETCSSVEELIKTQKPDAAHVLTPPNLHGRIATQLLEAGVDVLVEKPMAATGDECRAMLDAAAHSGAALRVNHNFIHHPAYARALQKISSGRCGPARRVQMRYAAPLRQMTARQFGRWMFNSPANLLLEQAVHPLSQIDNLMGGIEAVSATPGPERGVADGIKLVTDWMFDLECGDGLAQLQIVLGASYPSWTMSVLCDDGVVDADMFENRVTVRRPHASIAPLDMARRNLGAGLASIGEATRGVIEFAGELSRLGPPSDGFSRSMAGAVNAFHDELASGVRVQDETGLRLVRICEKAATEVSIAAPRITKTPGVDERYDVAVFGGTGFIGQHLTAQLVERGDKVAVMARNIANLPALFDHENVGVFKGAISDENAVRSVCSRAKKIVNLAHGGGGETREAIVRNMVSGAEAVARASSENERLIYVSSSAALYLGDEHEILTMESTADPQADERADYAYAKIRSEAAMRGFAELPLVIMRPAIVVGEGGAPFHSALGAYENETHCQGWNAGRNALPFILVGDVASAILSALDAPLEKVTGKAFNLAGDVRWNARRYTEELANATGRPLTFHGSSAALLYADEWLKWSVKKIAGRKSVATPSMRDIKSRGMVAKIDTSAEKELLDWVPCADETDFRARAIFPHAVDRS